jgi:putative membrane protein
MVWTIKSGNVLVGIVAALAFVGAAVTGYWMASGYGGGAGMMGWGGGWGDGSMFGFGLSGLVLVLVVVVVLARSWRGAASEDRALAILIEHHARGEMGNAEFDTRKRDLD